MTAQTIDDLVIVEFDVPNILTIDLYKLYEAYCKVSKTAYFQEDWRYLKTEGWHKFIEEGRLKYNNFTIENVKKTDELTGSEKTSGIKITVPNNINIKDELLWAGTLYFESKKTLHEEICD